jgi:putative Ca2+/H+ antiporter (TMEM165/GDT1 family)
VFGFDDLLDAGVVPDARWQNWTNSCCNIVTYIERYNAPLQVWLGGSLALCTKGALALTLGVSLRRRIPLYLVRALSTASCLVLGLIELCDLLRR